MEQLDCRATRVYIILRSHEKMSTAFRVEILWTIYRSVKQLRRFQTFPFRFILRIVIYGRLINHWSRVKNKISRENIVCTSFNLVTTLVREHTSVDVTLHSSHDVVRCNLLCFKHFSNRMFIYFFFFLFKREILTIIY